MKQKIVFNPCWLLLAICFVFAGSCKKNHDTENPAGDKYYIKFKEDGEQKEFRYSAGSGPADQKPSNGIYTFTLVAGKDVSSSGTNFIEVMLSSESIINSPGSFRDPLKSGGIWPQVQVTYMDNTNEAYLSMGLVSDAVGQSGPFENVVADAKASITSMDDGEVKGTFSASVYSGDDYSKKHILTSGEFYLPVH
jgi:hypothetical protein